MQPYKIAGIETDVNHWISGTQDNGTMYRNNSGLVVQHIGGGDGRSALIDPANVSNIFFSANETLNLSTDGGQTSVRFTPPGSDNSWPTLTHNINNFLELLVGYSNGIFKYNPATFTWSNRGAAGNTAIISCPSSSTRFYAAQGNIIYRSDDGGDTWTNLSNKPGLVLLQNGYNITDLSVSPANSGLVYATIGGFVEGQKIYMSNNAGETWTNISGELPNVATLSVAAGNAGSIYVGNELGVFYKKGNGTVWQPFYNGLPKCPVNDLLINLSQGKIRAATFGRGIWESDLYSPCATNEQVSGEVRGSRYYEAGSSLMATQQAAGGIGTQLVYKSGHNITLTTGMEVKDAATGTKFRAYLGPCGEGLQQLAVNADSALLTYTIEELDTYKNRPHNLIAYYVVKDDVLEFFVPDYAVIHITQTTADGKVHSLI
nr:hypothetical protein [Chitinophagaceae bacterium]